MEEGFVGWKKVDHGHDLYYSMVITVARMVR
jgi:hypothetical protein